MATLPRRQLNNQLAGVTAPLGSQQRSRQLLQSSTLAAQRAAQAAGLTFQPGATLSPTGQIVPTQVGQQAQQISQALQKPVAPTKTTAQVPQAPAPALGADEISRRQAESQLLRSLQPTQEQEQLQRQINALISSFETGRAGIQDQPIPLTFITGQQAALERRADVLAAPLQRQVALEQGKRQAAVDVARTKLGIEESRAERARAQRQEQAQREQAQFERQQAIRQERRDTRGELESARRFGIQQQTQAREFEEDVRRFGVQQNLAQRKFDENVRQFESQLALKRQEIAVEAGEEAGFKEAAQRRGLAQADFALTAVDRALTELPRGGRAGLLGSALSIIPGTPAFDFEQTLATVKAIIGFDELEQMRLASPTGGALGQISEREIDFLQSLRGSINIGQSPERLFENLQDIRKSFLTLRLINSPDGSTFQFDGATFTKKGDQIIEQ